MSEFQYRRKWDLLVAESGGDGLDLSGLRCVFEVTKKDTQTPNTAEFSIYNITPDTAARLKKSFTKIIVNGGYESNFGLLFSGNIKGFEYSKENTDTVLTISAGDGDKEYNYTVINKTLAAGATPDTIISEVSTAMGIGIGYKSVLPSTALPRGKVFYGRPSEFMREQADNTGCTWSIQDGRILMLKRSELLPGTAVLLTPNTGLIGTPQKTEDGLTGTCLLNPKLRIGAALKIESGISPDINGEYRIISFKQKGDTHGNDWYTEFTGLNINPTGGDEKVSEK